MKLRFKLGAMASALALAVGLGVGFAGPAAAAVKKMCIPLTTNGYETCAESIALANVIIDLVSPNEASGYNVPSGKGQISQGNSGLCMEFHTNDSIILAPCKGLASEEWTTSAGKEKNTTVFRSVYNTSFCLNADPYPNAEMVTAAKCSSTNSNLNQEWNTTTVL